MRRIALVGLGALLCLAAPAKAEVVVNISKSQQRLAVVVDGTETYRWPVSTGRRGYATPAGKFRPVRLERHWYSRQYELTPMPWAMFFHRGYAVHGTMEAYNLGHAASHGCVRLRTDNAATLFSLVRRQGLDNTKVVVMNGPLPATPGATTTTDASTPETIAAEHFAKASDDDVDAAKKPEGAGARQDIKQDIKVDEVRNHKKERFAAALSVSASGNERQVLRERDAWLRSLERKYGITR